MGCALVEMDGRFSLGVRLYSMTRAVATAPTAPEQTRPARGHPPGRASSPFGRQSAVPALSATESR
jgi:hypothetical protein